MERQKLTWSELTNAMWKFNEEHNITTKGGGKAELVGVAVISQDSFDTEYSEKSRSYAFTNHNKAFLPNMCSNSIFSNCLDGTDNGVRLDWYIHDGWDIEYCYIKEIKNG